MQRTAQQGAEDVVRVRLCIVLHLSVESDGYSTCVGNSDFKQRANSEALAIYILLRAIANHFKANAPYL